VEEQVGTAFARSNVCGKLAVHWWHVVLLVHHVDDGVVDALTIFHVDYAPEHIEHVHDLNKVTEPVVTLVVYNIYELCMFIEM
jgi:hypothetical protein